MKSLIAGSSLLLAFVAPFSLPTTVSASTVVPVVACPTIFGYDGIEQWKPQQIPVATTRKLAKHLNGYSNGRTTVLGPEGWTCSGSVGANGSESLSVYPIGSDPEQEGSPSIRVLLDYTGHNPGIDLVCGYFPASEAARRFEGDPEFPCTPLAESRVTEPVTADMVGYRDTMSGALGVVIYPQGAEGATGSVDIAIAECQLPRSRRPLCTPILDDFMVRNPLVVPAYFD